LVFVAQRPEVVLAKPALPAADERRHYDPIALLHFFDSAARLDNFAHEFVADHVAGPHAGNIAVNEMQIRSACSGHRHAEDRVVRVYN
jgi:hypothetical protein